MQLLAVERYARSEFSGSDNPDNYYRSSIWRRVLLSEAITAFVLSNGVLHARHLHAPLLLQIEGRDADTEADAYHCGVYRDYSPDGGNFNGMRDHSGFASRFRLGFRNRIRIWWWWNASRHLHGFGYCFLADRNSSGEFVTDCQIAAFISGR